MKKYLTAKKRNIIPIAVISFLLILISLFDGSIKSISYIEIVIVALVFLGFIFLLFLSEIYTFITIKDSCLKLNNVFSKKQLEISQIKKVYLHARLTNDLRFYYEIDGKLKYISFNINQYKKATVVELLDDIKKINPNIEDLEFTREVIAQNRMYS